ncbi:MAG: hypothetical protein ACTSWM_07740 [Alphaproteobacteria bacterium]
MSDAVTRALLPTASAGVAAAKPVAPTTTSDGDGSRQAVLIPRPSPALQALQAGDVVEATIDTRLRDGATRLATARYGPILATWPNAPAPGTPVQLQVLQPGPPVKLQLLPAALTQAHLPGRAGHPPVSSALVTALPPNQPAPIKPGTILQGQLFPNASPAIAGLSGTPAGSPPSQQLSVRILALHPPQQGGGGLANTTGDTLQATVQGSGSNHIRLQTEAGALTLRSNVSLPPRTRLTLQVLALPGTILPPTTADRAARQITALAHGWPALEESLAVLTVAAPEAAAHFLSTKLPQPGPQLTSGIIFFLSAIRGGRLQDWLGADLIRTLSEQNRSTLISQLADDFTQFAQLAAEPLSSEWRTALLPFLHDGLFQQLRIYLRERDHDQSASGQEDDQGTRFVIEAELSQIGALQLDGLIRQQRFDLIIRSQQALPGTMCSDICDIFKKSGAEADFAGNISFQVEPDFHVAPLEHLAGHAIGVFA